MPVIVKENKCRAFEDNIMNNVLTLFFAGVSV